jgi:putative ABC transport system permease protein
MFAIRYAIRTLLKTPGFTLIAIATIALGIAVNSAIFSVVNGVLLQPLPFPDESRVVELTTSTANEARSNYSAGDFTDLRQAATKLQAVAGFREDMATVAVEGREAELLESVLVTPGFFDVLGAPAALGRPFAAADGPAGGRKIAVLAHKAWTRLLNGDPGAVGRAIRINGETYTIAAVMPPEVSWPLDKDLWILSPLSVPPSPIVLPDPETNRDVQYFQAIARLRPGVPLADAQAELHAIASRVQQNAGAAASGRDFRAEEIRERVVGDVRDALLVIQGAVGLVLLIACANVSSLLIARATGRRRELAIRAALGAGRGHLIRQMLTESIVLGIAGGVCGLLLSGWLINILQRFVPASLPRTDMIALDTRVMVATLAASLAVGILFGLLPALQASRARAGSVIKEAGERGSSARARGRAALVVAEIALTLVLLVGAGLLANSFLRLQRVDPGFRVEHAMLGHLLVPQSRYTTPEQIVSLYRRLVEGLSARSDLQAVGVGFPGPLRGDNAGGAFFVEGRAAATRADRPYANIGTVSGGYFAAMGIPLIAGRTFAETDVKSAPPVAIVSAALARKYWPGENPVGKRFRFDDDPKAPWTTVVGLVGDVRQLGLRREPPPLLFFPYSQFTLPFTTLVVRSALPEATVIALMRQQLGEIDRDLSLGDVLPLQTTIARHMDQPRFRALLIGIFAVLALALAAVGVYGLISFTVAERTREIGIRVALGAAPRQVLLPVVREGLVLALAGLAIGLAGAFAAARALTAFLFGVGATDPLTFAGVALLLLIVALLASYIPSRRALKVDPIVALRAE